MNDIYTLRDIAAILSEETGKSPSESERFLQEFIKVVSDGVCTDKVVKVNGLGTFELVAVPESESISTYTGKHYIVPAHYKFLFSPDKGLKELVNRPFSLFEITELNEEVTFSDIDTPDDDDRKTDESEDSIEEIMPEPILVQESPAVEEEVQLVQNEDSVKRIERKKTAVRWKYLLACLSVFAVLFACFILLFYKKDEMKKTTDYVENGYEKEMSGRDTVAGSEIVADSTGLSMDSLNVNTHKTDTDYYEDLDTVSIKQGDRLTLLSLHYYGHKFFWVYIYEYNKAAITDPNNVPTGTRLRIPNAKKYGIDRNDRCSIEKAIALQSEILSGR